MDATWRLHSDWNSTFVVDLPSMTIVNQMNREAVLVLNAAKPLTAFQ